MWLLRRVAADGEEDVPDIPDGYTALHPLDYQAPSLFPRIHVLALRVGTRAEDSSEVR